MHRRRSRGEYKLVGGQHFAVATLYGDLDVCIGMPTYANVRLFLLPMAIRTLEHE